MTGADAVFEDAAAALDLRALQPVVGRRRFLSRMARESGGGVLDPGCGTGMLACRIVDEVFDVVGVDPAEAMLRVACARPGSGNVTWARSDGQSLDLS